MYTITKEKRILRVDFEDFQGKIKKEKGSQNSLGTLFIKWCDRRSYLQLFFTPIMIGTNINQANRIISFLLNCNIVYKILYIKQFAWVLSIFTNFIDISTFF